MTGSPIKRIEVLRQKFSTSFGSLFGERQELLESVQYRLLDKGTVLMRPGNTCQQLPLVVSGSIRVFKAAENGREITLYRIGPGQSCMLSTACGSGPLSFPATAQAEQSTAAAFLPDSTVSTLLAQVPAFSKFIIDQYAQRTMEVMELVDEVAFRHVDERLLEHLRDRAENATVTSTHRELADQIGTSREVVSRILKDWEDQGRVRLGRGSVTLLEGFAGRSGD